MTEFEVALQEHLENNLNPHSVTKAQVGLGNVDNTKDMDKPVSTLQERRMVEIEANALPRNNTKPFTPTEPYHPATKEYVDDKASSTTSFITLTAAGWTASAPYTQAVPVTGMLATDNPIADIVSPTVDSLGAWNKVSWLETSDGLVTAVCLEGKPQTDIALQLKVIR